jgi:hypothetical protein
MDTQSASVDRGFRAVTPEEISHYQEQGWVKLEKFVPLDRVSDLLAFAKDKMGEDGDRNAPPEAFTYFNPLTIHGFDKPVFKPVIDQAARNAKALMARRAPIGIRYFSDYFAVKLPTGKTTGHGGNGSSDWHQDYAAWASDRSGGMTFWLALTDLAPETGTMAFLSGSHRFGALGHFATHEHGDLLDEYPELLDTCTPTAHLSYAAGDVTVHSNLTVHSAGTNRTTEPRWTYSVLVNLANACWTGAAADAFDTSGLVLHRPMDDERFPVLA